jgi:hypothetical protein
LTFKKQLNDIFSVRFTQDITLDREGGDAGNVELKMKYCYLKIAPSDIDLLTHSYFEVGLVHRPWLDFEQEINNYRVQGTMFLERIGMYNSADFGVTFVSLLGGKINQNFIKRTGTEQIGKLGSFALGVYNGGGYHAIEQNKNKTIEGRLTLRPLYRVLPGIKLSYNFAYGSGNTTENPAFHLNSVFLSHESKYFNLSGQYFFGKGNSSGTGISVDSTNAFQNTGYSMFCEFSVPHTPLAVFGRYDTRQTKHMNYLSERWIGGICYYFYKTCKLLVDIDYADLGGTSTNIYEAAVEIDF